MVDAEYEINNVVLTVFYKDVELDLEKIASSLDGARYDPEVSPGVAYKTSKPKASFLIFASYSWRPAYDRLEEIGIEPKLAHPNELEAISNSEFAGVGAPDWAEESPF